MRGAADGMVTFAVIIAWIAGIVLAPVWLKVLAFVFPPYPLYLIVERALQVIGFI